MKKCVLMFSALVITIIIATYVNKINVNPEKDALLLETRSLDSLLLTSNNYSYKN